MSWRSLLIWQRSWKGPGKVLIFGRPRCVGTLCSVFAGEIFLQEESLLPPVNTKYIYKSAYHHESSLTDTCRQGEVLDGTLPLAPPSGCKQKLVSVNRQLQRWLGLLFWSLRFGKMWESLWLLGCWYMKIGWISNLIPWCYIDWDNNTLHLDVVSMVQLQYAM